MQTPYLSLEALVSLIESPNRQECERVLEDPTGSLTWAWGSTHNHQQWSGGYLDHVTEAMNIAATLYRTLDACRPLPFSLSDALLVLFLHDIEKPWRFRYGTDGEREAVADMATKAQRKSFRERFISARRFVLTPAHMNALTYVEGEHDDYSSKRRVMNELAAFCHMCDVASARLWHDCPRQEDDPWKPAARHRKP